MGGRKAVPSSLQLAALWPSGPDGLAGFGPLEPRWIHRGVLSLGGRAGTGSGQWFLAGRPGKRSGNLLQPLCSGIKSAREHMEPGGRKSIQEKHGPRSSPALCSLGTSSPSLDTEGLPPLPRGPMASWPASDLWLFPTGILLGGRQPERNREDEGPVPARDHGEAEELDQPHPLPGQHLGLQRGWRRAPE